ncbi:CRISPR-associated endonuclease Cas2 [Thiolapillus sp.]
MLAYVACFDISDDAIRRNVSRRLEHFGCRVQRSVFEISVESADELEKLRLELLEWIDAEEVDDVRFYPLCRECRQKARDVRGRRVAEFPAAVIA